MNTILVTGAAGAVGQALLAALGATPLAARTFATDLRRPADLPTGMRFMALDVTSEDSGRVIGAVKPRAVVHLASIVTPPKGMARETAFAVDVTGTKNVLDACLAHGVYRLVVTSSGAAYGYHVDNPVPLTEGDPVRGNPEFAYSDHKRQVEEMLASTRAAHPELEQVVLRVGTVIGPAIDNQITALFGKPQLLAAGRSESPFVFIWTQDLARILMRAATDGPPGIFNVAGDGAMGISEIAAALGKPVLRIPVWLLKAALAIAQPLGLSRYGPEQVRFLQYRPVLDNTALKTVFGYRPEKTSAEAFATWAEAQR
ncbi:MAG: SDR family oxidoreductase [Notoacmeibacter sp.]|nr:SDR family oxidoreductase [Notoacmeibacter sp.]